jgi:hypothetical protein
MLVSVVQTNAPSPMAWMARRFSVRLQKIARSGCPSGYWDDAMPISSSIACTESTGRGYYQDRLKLTFIEQ